MKKIISIIGAIAILAAICMSVSSCRKVDVTKTLMGTEWRNDVEGFRYILKFSTESTGLIRKISGGSEISSVFDYQYSYPEVYITYEEFFGSDKGKVNGDKLELGTVVYTRVK